MNLTRFPVNPFVELTYILWTGDGGDAIVVDPGMMAAAERDEVVQFLDSHRLTLRHILLTHLHIDHVASAAWMAQRYNLPIEGGQADEALGALLPKQAEHFRIGIELNPLKLDRYLSQGDTLTLGDEEIRVLEVPGHSPGSLAYYVPTSNFVLSGDTLFSGSIGRTDLPGGDFGILVKAINDKLMTLPADTMVYPGHNRETTIGDELRYNPFIN
ncbi:MAG: MBL fold metallo-hydrolase [Muribaculaceae bacterium]|nr:MBL fold metallo-hydrolase [Muribaculaceae bacterium]